MALFRRSKFAVTGFDYFNRKVCRICPKDFFRKTCETNRNLSITAGLAREITGQAENKPRSNPRDN